MKIHITTFATYKTDTNVLLFFSGTIDFPWAKSHIERKIRNRLPLFLHTLNLAYKTTKQTLLSLSQSIIIPTFISRYLRYKA